MPLRFDPPIHPGEILREQFLEPLDLSAGALAKAIGVPRTRVERIVKEEMGISADTALRLARYFDTTPNVWLNLQNDYEISVGQRQLKRELAAIRPRAA
jgi:addiction module HigA family antidote